MLNFAFCDGVGETLPGGEFRYSFAPLRDGALRQATVSMARTGGNINWFFLFNSRPAYYALELDGEVVDTKRLSDSGNERQLGNARSATIRLPATEEQLVATGRPPSSNEGAESSVEGFDCMPLALFIERPDDEPPLERPFAGEREEHWQISPVSTSREPTDEAWRVGGPLEEVDAWRETTVPLALEESEAT